MPKKEDKITVQAELGVVSDGGPAQVIRTFDKAWHLALTLPTPTTITFIRFARID